MLTLLAQIRHFAPNIFLRRLQRDPVPMKSPQEEGFEAALLFADISGFTRLTETLTRNNPAGVGELGNILNIYIGKLIELIAGHGGDIVKFAGDALFAVWRVEPGSTLSQEAQRAVLCGLEAQKKLHNFKVASGISLSLTMGIGVGELHALFVGGTFDRWEFLIAGDPMNQVSKAGKISQPGQVVISPQTANLLRTGGFGRKSGKDRLILSGNREIPVAKPLEAIMLNTDAEEGLRAFVPRAVLSLIDRGLSPWQPEMRPVTVLFLKVNDFSYTSSTPIQEVQRLMKAMQRALYAFFGSINRFGVDDKGAVLLAAFGLPPLQPKDDAIRAVKAAFLLSEELKKENHQCVIGIASGTVFCGSVGNEIRAEYTMHGANVNFAARLMQHAQDILCDENTRQKCLKEIEFERLDPITVKGKDEPVVVYRPIGLVSQQQN